MPKRYCPTLIKLVTVTYQNSTKYMKNTIILLLSIVFFFSCEMSKQTTANTTTTSPAATLLKKVIQAHGGKKYDTAHYQFKFRDKTYTFSNDEAQYCYTSTQEKEGKTIIDVLNNEGFTRTINGNPTRLSEKQKTSYTGTLNSVIYFATLPHKLSDPAVNLALVGTSTISGTTYDLLQVTFDEEGGGTDHDDEFLYWIDQTTHKIGFLAYNYQVNSGGVRFRAAYNQRIIGGIVFQNYVNYKADVGTPLKDLAGLYEQEKLKQLSLIETEEVVEIK